MDRGHNKATAAFILGIIGVVMMFGGYSAIVSLGCGIAGLICAAAAKSAGNTEGIRTAGFVMSLICVILGSLIFVSCIACTVLGTSIGCAAIAEGISSSMR